MSKQKVKAHLIIFNGWNDSSSRFDQWQGKR